MAAQLQVPQFEIKDNYYIVPVGIHLYRFPSIKPLINPSI